MVTLWLACLPRLGDRVLVDPDADFDGDGFDELAGDCNDRDPSVHPGAVTIPGNALDEDCDGIDEPAVSSGGPVDADGDGATEDEDCDDHDPARYPWAPEICGDAVDQDCDGQSPACRLVGEVSLDALWSEGPGLGAPLWSAGDLDGDLRPQILVSDPERPSMALLSWVDGPPARLELTYRVTAIDPDSGLGTAAAGPADVDGDGLGDVVLGLPGATLAQGEVLILPGPATVDIVVGPVPPYSALVVSGGPSMALGAAVGAVDIDGDGALDLAASQGTAAGATWLLYGPPGPDTEIAEIDGTATFVAQGPDAGAGASLATGDLDADGLADLAIAVEGGLANGPRVAIVPGGSDRYGGLLDLDMFDAIAAEGGIGWSAPSLATASDVDGEGTGDLIVGWPQAGPGVAGAGGGVVSLFVGPIASTDAWLGAHLSVLGRQLGDETGASVSSADLDGDATHELVYGLPGVGDGAGAVHMADGAAAGVLDLATATPLAFVVGTIGDARLGASVAGLDDLDGDGWDDVAVGSPGLAGVGLLWGGPID